MKEDQYSESPVTLGKIVPQQITIRNEGVLDTSAKFADSSGSCVIEDEALITIEEGKQRYSANNASNVMETPTTQENVTPMARQVTVEIMDMTPTPRRECETAPQETEKCSTRSDMREKSSARRSERREPTTEFNLKESDGDDEGDEAYALIQVPKPLEPFNSSRDDDEDVEELQPMQLNIIRE